MRCVNSPNNLRAFYARLGVLRKKIPEGDFLYAIVAALQRIYAAYLRKNTRLFTRSLRNSGGKAPAA